MSSPVSPPLPVRPRDPAGRFLPRDRAPLPPVGVTALTVATYCDTYTPVPDPDVCGHGFPRVSCPHGAPVVS